MSISNERTNAPLRRALIAASIVGASVAFAAPGTRTARDVLPRLEKRRERVRTLHHKTKTTVTGQAKQVTRTITVETWERQEKDVRQFHTISTTEAGRGNKDRSDAHAKPNESHTVSDGDTTWREVAHGDTLLVVKSDAGSNPNRLTDLLRPGQSKIKGREKIAGEPCLIMQTTTTDRGGAHTDTYWISESYGIILKSQTTLRDGSVAQMTTVKLDVNEPLSGANFNYEPPEGATVLDTNALRGGGG